MAGFDPYHRWLAIPPEDQPPNHYRLLGLQLYEDDPEVIEAAVDSRINYVRGFLEGKHATEADQIMNEIAAVQIMLLAPDKKSAYDLHLRTKLEKQAQPQQKKKQLLVAKSLSLETAQPAAAREQQSSSPAISAPTVTTQPATPLKDRNSRKDFPKILLLGMIACGAILLLGVAAVLVALQSTSNEDPVASVDGFSHDTAAVGLSNTSTDQNHNTASSHGQSETSQAAISTTSVVWPSTGLVAHWNFDEGRGDTVQDTVAGKLGSISGATWSDGIRGSALSFDGVNDVVLFGNPDDLNFTGPITLSAWVRIPVDFNRANHFGYILNHGYTYSPGREVTLRFSNERGPRFQTGTFIRLPNTNQYNFMATVRHEDSDCGKWIHLAGVGTLDSWRLFVNGNLVNQVKTKHAALEINEGWAVGAHPSRSERYFHGEVDEVRIYDRALSEAEVKLLATP